MNYRGLDLNLVVALDALLTHVNVTRAAEALHLSQSAMSGSLARLRAHYDDQLLVRCGTAFKLTSVAEGLVGPIRSALLQMDAALDLQPHFDAAASTRHFRVMATDYISVVLLAPALRAAASIARGLSFTVVPFAKAPHEALERGDVDLLIIADHLVSADEPFEALFEDDYVCVCAAENEAAHEGLSVEGFLSLGHVVCRYGNGAIPYIEERFFRDAGYHRRIEVVASSFGEVPHYLVGNERVAITHRKLAEFYARTMPLRLFAPPVPTPLVKHAAQWHSYRHKDPAIEWLRGVLQTTAADLVAASSGPDALSAPPPRRASARG